MTEQKAGNDLFPIFLKLEKLRLLIVGGGKVGLEKLHAVVHNSPGTKITVVAKEISPAIKELASQHAGISLVERAYEPADLDDCDIAIVAVNDRSLSLGIHTDAKQKDKLLNVADTPELCDFYLSSIVKKGNLKIAISTNGKSPTIAKRLKETFNEALPGELDEVLDNMQVIRNRLNGNFEDKVKKLNALTKVLVERDNEGNGKRWKKIASYSVTAFALMLIGHFIFSYIPIRQLVDEGAAWYKTLDPNFHWMVLAGFLAQMVDGATSMGYGVTSSIVLQTAQISPAAISAGIHTAEMFTSGASGYSHYKFGNVNKKLFKSLVIPCIIGAVLCALLLVGFVDKHLVYLRPAMALYTLVLGIRIFSNAFRSSGKSKFKRYGWLAGAGGFLDSFGGGGWGPIVTSTLITKGRTPRYVIGSVSLTEFFVTLASAFTFFTLIGVQNWQIIVALVIGGVIAAPIAAQLAGKLPKKTSFILLGTVVVLWSIRILSKTPWPF